MPEQIEVEAADKRRKIPEFMLRFYNPLLSDETVTELQRRRNAGYELGEKHGYDKGVADATRAANQQRDEAVANARREMRETVRENNERARAREQVFVDAIQQIETVLDTLRKELLEVVREKEVARDM